MKKLLLLSTVLIFSVPVMAQTFDLGSRLKGMGKDSINIQDLQGNLFKMGKSKSGNPFMESGKKNVPMGTMSVEALGKDKTRFGMGGEYADIQADPKNPNKVIMTNPNGNQKISMETIENKKTGEVDMITRDERTGEVIRHIRKGADGSMKTLVAKDGPNGTDLFKRTQTKVEGGYKKELKMELGKAEILIRNAQTNALKYRAVVQNGYDRLYDANNKLIAEGKENDKNFKIYNQKAYNDFKKIMESGDL